MSRGAFKSISGWSLSVLNPCVSYPGSTNRVPPAETKWSLPSDMVSVHNRIYGWLISLSRLILYQCCLGQYQNFCDRVVIFKQSDIMLSLSFLELFLILEVAVAATTDSSSLPLMLSSNNTNPSPSLRLPYGSTYICDPRSYEPTSLQSCETAANQVQGSRDRLKFAQRQSGVDGISIPHNWVSSMSLL